jgi:hypothetical protein
MSDAPNPLDRETIQQASQEAAQRALDFRPEERATYVRAMIHRVFEYQQAGRTVAQIKTLLPEFIEEYRHLFEMITQPEGYDKAQLQGMLALLDKMGTGRLTQHQASVVVGKQILEKYHKGPSKEDAL